MYPIVTLWSYVIDITGLTILISMITLLLSIFILVRKSRLQFVKFFYRLPLPLVLSYLLGAYVSFVITYGLPIPLNLTQRQIMLSPFGYRFHIIGIMLAITMSLRLFLKKMPSRHERRMWINIIASSISLTMIPLGLGLLMGDHLVWLPTQSSRGVETFRPDISSWSRYGAVYPIGFYMAILGLLTFLIQRIRQRMDRPSGQWYLTLALIAIGIGLIRVFVNTPKYLVMQVGSMRWDVTTYLCIGIAALLLQQYMIEQHRVSSLPSTSS